MEVLRVNGVSVQICNWERSPLAKNFANSYFSATSLCKAGGGANFRVWKELPSTDAAMRVIAKELGVSPLSLIKSISKGGYIWIHRALVSNLTAWISPEFAALVSSQIEELNMRKRIQSEFEQLPDVRTDVSLRPHYIDVITDSHIIAIEECGKWREAIGRVVCCGRDYPYHKRQIYLFDVKRAAESEPIEEVCGHFGIEVVYHDESHGISHVPQTADRDPEDTVVKMSKFGHFPIWPCGRQGG